MDVSINWATRVITVPRSQLTPLGGNNYGLDVNAFRLALKDIEDSEEGMGQPDTHRHNTTVTLSGVSYARVFEIINGYTVLFPDEAQHYSVICTGANHNIADVYVPSQTSLVIGNAAGLIQVSSGSGLSAEQAQQLQELFVLQGLQAGTPLVVTPTSRAAGGVAQSIDEAGTTVTVTRT